MRCPRCFTPITKVLNHECQRLYPSPKLESNDPLYFMIYTTMTRNRLLRLAGAKGWLLTGQLFNDLYHDSFDYYEVAFVPELSLLRGNGYDLNA